MNLQALDEHEITLTFCPQRNPEEGVFLHLQKYSVPKSQMSRKHLLIYEEIEGVIGDFIETVRRLAQEWDRYKAIAAKTAEAVKTLRVIIFDNLHSHRRGIKQLLINLNAQGDYVSGAVTRLRHRHYVKRPCSLKTHNTLSSLLRKVTSTYKLLYERFEEALEHTALSLRVPARNNELVDLHLHQQLRILAERLIRFEGVDYEEVYRCTTEGILCGCLLYIWEE